MFVLAAVIIGIGGIVGAVTTRQGKKPRRSPRVAASSSLEDEEQNNDNEKVEFEFDNEDEEQEQAQAKERKKKRKTGKGSNPRSWDALVEWREHIRMTEGYFGPDTVILLQLVLFGIPIDIPNWPTNIGVMIILVGGINKVELTNPYEFFVIGMGMKDMSDALNQLRLWGFFIDWDLSTGGLEVNDQRKKLLLEDPNAKLVMYNTQIVWSDPRSSIPQIRDAPMVTEKASLAVRVTGSQGNTQHQNKNKDVFVYDVREYRHDELVKISKGLESIAGKNSVKAVVQMKNEVLCQVCKAARDELNPKTCRESQPSKKLVKPALRGKGKPPGIHFTIVARLVKKASLKPKAK